MICCTKEPTTDTLEPTASFTHNNAQQQQKNTLTMVPPSCWLSTAPILQVSNCRTLRDQSRSSQHSDITYIDKTYCSVILFTIILQAVAWRARGQKVSLISYYSCFLGATASEQRTLTSAIWQYFICQYPTSTSHISAWFWTRGGGAIVTMFSGGEVGCGCC